MVTKNQHRSVIEIAFNPYLRGWGGIQSIIYGTTFVISLAAALIADLILGQSEVLSALLGISIALVLLFVAPLLSALTHKRAIANKAYVDLYRKHETLVIRVSQLAEQIGDSSLPFEMVLSPDSANDLELLIRTSSAASIIQYVQDLVFSDSHLRVLLGTETAPTARNITLPADLKALLDQVGKAAGFVSGEKYLAFVLGTKADKVREDQEKERREAEERKRGNASPPGKVFLIEKHFDPSRSGERWPVEVVSLTTKHKVI